MSVKVREKRGKLYLDIYQGGKRTWEALHLELTRDKAQNKEIWRLAEICRSKRETQLLTGAWDINDPIAGKISLIGYLEKYSSNYKSPSVVNCCIKYIPGLKSTSDGTRPGIPSRCYPWNPGPRFTPFQSCWAIPA